MRFSLLAAVTAAALAGCVTQPLDFGPRSSAPPAPVAVDPSIPQPGDSPDAAAYRQKLARRYDTPRCTTTRECEVMWANAMRAVELVSNMRVRLATDTRIETFAPTRFGRTGAVVDKVPVGDAGYEIQVRIECYGRSGCGDLQQQGRRIFNSQVNP